VTALGRIADQKKVTVAQLAIAWVLHQGTDIFPLIGARNREQLRESLGALQVQLSADDVRHLESAVPPESVAGTRYDATGMALLDSEKRRA
jgi:pyridoxine 4-dehydrogenase